jgi:hypothetical protein
MNMNEDEARPLLADFGWQEQPLLVPYDLLEALHEVEMEMDSEIPLPQTVSMIAPDRPGRGLKAGLYEYRHPEHPGQITVSGDSWWWSVNDDTATQVSGESAEELREFLTDMPWKAATFSDEPELVGDPDDEEES